MAKQSRLLKNGITFLDTFGMLHIVIKLIKLTIDKDVY